MTPFEELEARRKGERDKTLAKYGPDALVETGRPDVDIFDYAINELVGLTRYAEMIAARAKMMGQLLVGPGAGGRRIREAAKECRAIAGAMDSSARRHALELIAVRQAFKSEGLMLGAPEGKF